MADVRPTRLRASVFWLLISCIAGSYLVAKLVFRDRADFVAPPVHFVADVIGNQAYSTSPGIERYISIPATGFSAISSTDGWHWTRVGAGRGGESPFMQAKMRASDYSHPDDVDARPRLDYPVTFDTKGIHYVWIHGSGHRDESGFDIGLNGHALDLATGVAGFGPSSRRVVGFLPWPLRKFNWSRQTIAGYPGVIEVANTGTYMVNVWPIGDYVKFDKLVFARGYESQPTAEEPTDSVLTQRRQVAPEFSRSNGVFVGEEEIWIVDEPQSEARYTIDGSDPLNSETAEIASSRFVVSESATIKAVARSPGTAPSEISALSLEKVTCPPYRIMPLGDSITLGIYGPLDAGPLLGVRGGYRAPLYRNLVEAGYSVDFVGSLNAGWELHPMIDPDHEGRDGWSSRQLAAETYEILRAGRPDFVLLHVGTNEFTTSVDSLNDVLREIDRFESESGRQVTVLVAKIVNRKYVHAETTTYNEELEKLVHERTSIGDSIAIVDIEKSLSYPDDLYDDLHPNQTGYAKMGAAWFDALTPWLSVCDKWIPELQ